MLATVDSTTNGGSQLELSLSKLNAKRAKNPGLRKSVGRVIYRTLDGSANGLRIWKEWVMARDPNTSPDKAEQEWNSDDFKLSKVEMTVTDAMGALEKWVEEDGKEIKPASESPKPKDYQEAYNKLGWHFNLNAMNDRLYVNGEEFTDPISAMIMTQLGNLGFKSNDVFKRTALAEGQENQFHPIKDYLNGLKWDGQDRFAEIGKFIADKDGMFATFLRKWMIGAVAKVLNPQPEEQNPMLVLSGPQGIGKSVFVAWLGSPLKEYYTSNPIKPDDKDWQGYASSYFVWEVGELGATLNRQDVEALKWFVNQWRFTWTPRYGHFETTKPVTASYIGTINPNGVGFLNDPTGNRRFRVCEIITFGGPEFPYSKEIDVNQLWAQAVALHKQGETYQLTDSDEITVQEINSRHEVEEPLEEHMATFLEQDEAHKDWRVSIAQILTVLKVRGIINDVTNRGLQMRVSSVLTKWGCQKAENAFRVNGKLARGFMGVRLNSVAEIQAKPI